MAKGATSKGNLSLNPSLLVLLNFLVTALSTGTDSLSCNFIVKHRNSSGQCSVNGKSLFYFDDEKQEENATEVCADLYQSLKDTFDKIMKLESGLFKSKGNNPLQIRIQSQYHQGEFTDGCWAFSVDEQYSFYFYPKNMTWREGHPDAIRTMRQWESNRELVQSLRTLSRGDFSHCLKKLKHSREMPRSTMKTLDTTQPKYGTHNQSTANTTQVTSGTLGLSFTLKVSLYVGGSIIIIILFLIILFWCIKM